MTDIKIAKGGITVGVTTDRTFIPWSAVAKVDEFMYRVHIITSSGQTVVCGPSSDSHWASDLFDAIVKAMGGEV